MTVLASWSEGGATPPAIVQVWIDRAGIEAAASAFGVDERQRFRRALAGALAPRRCSGDAPGPAFACLEPRALAAQVFPALICPTAGAVWVDRVEAFFATLEAQRLVRGFVSGLGPTIVVFRIERAGHGWAIAETHRSDPADRHARTHGILAPGC